MQRFTSLPPDTRFISRCGLEWLQVADRRDVTCNPDVKCFVCPDGRYYEFIQNNKLVEVYGMAVDMSGLGVIYFFKRHNGERDVFLDDNVKSRYIDITTVTGTSNLTLMSAKIYSKSSDPALGLMAEGCTTIDTVDGITQRLFNFGKYVSVLLSLQDTIQHCVYEEKPPRLKIRSLMGMEFEVKLLSHALFREHEVTYVKNVLLKKKTDLYPLDVMKIEPGPCESDKRKITPNLQNEDNGNGNQIKDKNEDNSSG